VRSGDTATVAAKAKSRSDGQEKSATGDRQASSMQREK
jgi:hypothetical protein